MHNKILKSLLYSFFEKPQNEFILHCLFFDLNMYLS